MTTIGTHTRAGRRLAAFIIVGVLAFSLVAIATVGAEANDSAGRIFAGLGDYIAAMSEALGR